MIKLEKPMVTDLYLPRPAGDCCITKHTFTRKDIFEILQNYISYDDAREILDEIFEEYIAGDNELVEIILNAVGDVYTREQIDELLESYVPGGLIEESTFRAYTAATETRIAELEAKVVSRPPATLIMIDDFPDGMNSMCWDPETGEEIPCEDLYTGRYCDDYMNDFYGYSDLDEYLDNYLSRPAEMGCNSYLYVGEMEYDGDDYWLYQNNTEGWATSVKFALLPKTTTRQELIENSLTTDHQNIFNDYAPFAYILQPDGIEYELSSAMPYILVNII